MNILANQAAFLSMIRHAEGTDRAADPYRVCYGYRHTIVSLAEHPAISGEWKGESIANLGPQYARLISTAAGAYQITKHTWLGCRELLDLPDFSAASQDLAALFLIKNAHALDLVNVGALSAAIAACRNVWASLPGGKSGQPQRPLATLAMAYTTAGGALA